MKITRIKILYKCDKCDLRGHIQDDKYSSHSCDCDWAVEHGIQLGRGKLIIKKKSVDN